ncbi:MAG TPA: cation diffusion facilitator family transporter [Sphingomicrobium sp.]|nr:cation diffusion facilitator family transporter [Sphingomicrobium sp.]
MADGSTRVVYVALLGNVLVAVLKFAAALISGSSAMLTEAIHSTADCTNQLLLLIGVRRGRLPADATHPFGYGMEIYFWTFIVAVVVLLVGGAVSIFQGVREFASPHPIESPVVNFVVLLLSALFEGYSFSVGYRAYRSLVARHSVPGLTPNLFKFIAWSKDPSLFESLLEDGTALAGIAVAAAGIAASVFFGLLRADGLASIVIGLLLVANSFAILVATRGLIAGEAAAPTLLYDLEQALKGQQWSGRIKNIDTLHLGPGCVLIAVVLESDQSKSLDRRLSLEIAARLKAVDERVIEVLFQFSNGKD